MGEEFVHAREAWVSVLEEYHSEGGLGYAALQRSREDLDVFLESLQTARPEGLGAQDQLAFWINAHNAVVVHQVLERYPGVTSVKEVDGFFDDLRYPVGGRRLTLDEIEARARDLGDPRVHFAVGCASTSCPDLRPEPYRGGQAR